MLEELGPLFKTVTEMEAEALQDVAEVMHAKHRHIELLSTLCREWTKCLS